VGEVAYMGFMFEAASSFNQNLCAWGPKITDRTIVMEGMFFASSCPSQGDPDLTLDPITPLCFSCA
jgi:hypothetical protein